MKNLFLLAMTLVLAGTLFTACKSNSGSREFIPGKGWVPTN